jgi:hypothetical protein
MPPKQNRIRLHERKTQVLAALDSGTEISNQHTFGTEKIMGEGQRKQWYQQRNRRINGATGEYMGLVRDVQPEPGSTLSSAYRTYIAAFLL